jgi:PIN domain nuclease of toxin-antitoxin system
MKNNFVLDACALIAFLSDEDGADKVQDLILCITTINRLAIHSGLQPAL